MGLVEKQRKESFLSFLGAEPRKLPACQHVSEGCGGCLLQEYEYAAQVRAKEQYLQSVYGAKVDVAPAPASLGYRNRMDFVTAFGKTGLRKRARFAQVVDIKDCLLLPEHARRAYTLARNILRESGLQDYNYVRHEGWLRYIVVRTSQATGETMLIITSKPPRDDAEAARIQAILEDIRARTGAASVHWTINDGKADISIGAQFWHCGEPSIIDEIAGRRFRITPQTFFQANTVLASDLFERAVAYAEGRVLDLCCGVGVISIIASQQPRVSSVTGVELVAQSIAMAKENLALNDAAARCEFVCADASDFLSANAKRFDTVICDPARPGLGPDVCARLLAMRPKRIIYISCNPLSHKTDLALLSAAYHLTLLEGYDLFPQTPHVEILSMLERRA
jgi:23S rRNA (uracil-5-)-methyltransferase RumA